MALFCIWLVVAATESYHLTRGWDTSRLFVPLFADNIERSSIKNSRGDTVKAETVGVPGRDDPSPTVIRLKRAHHWLSTTLLNAESYGLHYHGEWLDDNTVDITLVFGCLVRLRTPVTRVGPIHISYHLTEGGRTLGSCPPGTSPRSEPLPARIPDDQ